MLTLKCECCEGSVKFSIVKEGLGGLVAAGGFYCPLCSNYILSTPYTVIAVTIKLDTDELMYCTRCVNFTDERIENRVTKTQYIEAEMNVMCAGCGVDFEDLVYPNMSTEINYNTMNEAIEDIQKPPVPGNDRGFNFFGSKG